MSLNRELRRVLLDVRETCDKIERACEPLSLYYHYATGKRPLKALAAELRKERRRLELLARRIDHA